MTDDSRRPNWPERFLGIFTEVRADEGLLALALLGFLLMTAYCVIHWCRRR